MARSWIRMSLAMVLLSVGVSMYAEEAAPQPKEDVTAYLDKLYTKLEHTARRSNEPTSDASHVVGVRGSKQEPTQKKLYWKGKKTTDIVRPEEVKEFRSLVELARAGKKDDAIKGMEGFAEKYPKSPLLPDVQEALKVLKAS